MPSLKKILIRLGLKKRKGPAPNPHISIGRYTYLQSTAKILFAEENGPVSIGQFCSIADGVIILGAGEHPTHNATTFPLGDWFSNAKPYRNVGRGPTRIGNDVWIGVNAVILSGVAVGDGAIVGAGAIVSRDVPPYAVVLGNPAQVTRYRFTPDIVSALQQIRWWDWSKEKIETEMPSLEDNVEAFVARHAVPR